MNVPSSLATLVPPVPSPPPWLARRPRTVGAERNKCRWANLASKNGANRSETPRSRLDDAAKSGYAPMTPCATPLRTFFSLAVPPFLLMSH
jgi:hypothetical protein